MTPPPSTLHFCRSTSACPAPQHPVRDNERTFQVATLSSPVWDRALVICLVFCLRRLSGAPFSYLSKLNSSFCYRFYVWSIYLGTCLACVCRHRGGSAAPICVGRSGVQAPPLVFPPNGAFQRFFRVARYRLRHREGPCVSGLHWSELSAQVSQGRSSYSSCSHPQMDDPQTRSCRNYRVCAESGGRERFLIRM